LTEETVWMRSFVYHAEFEPGARRGFVVSFPDVPEAITQGDDMADARTMAEEALGRLPGSGAASAKGKGQRP
jgi:hypothetical protein